MSRDPTRGIRHGQIIQSGNRNTQNFGVKRVLKTFGSVFLVLLSCGAVAYGLAAVISYFLDGQITNSNSSVNSTTHSSNSPALLDNARLYGWYIIVFVLGGTLASVFGTTVWLIIARMMPRPETSPRYSRPSAKRSLLHAKKTKPYANSEFRIVGYYEETKNYEIRESQLGKLTHVIFSYLDMNSNGSLTFSNFPMRKRFLNLVEMARKVNPGLKVMISILENFSVFKVVAESEEKRKNLANNIATFILTQQIDGVDIFWDRPQEAKHPELYVLLLSEIRQKLTEIETPSRETSYLLSVGVPGFDWNYLTEFIDLNGMMEHVDFVNVTSTKYYGMWTSKWGQYTGPPAPLYSGIGQYEDSNVDWTMKFLSNTTGNPKTLNMGVPFFGAYWMNVEGPIDEKEEMWFTAKSKIEGKHDYEGGYLPRGSSKRMVGICRKRFGIMILDVHLYGIQQRRSFWDSKIKEV
ncbi:hypothetical protein CAEBREN_32109 [Caenorhabditis brenneri]|uniref:GH18 domain-containing protein n=1 Tax=Caenorhabditis brenneri TaxID=135651 RepID=G0NN35_CAEBE|nr:hypothetical protein CAEBREN_32109 [Caenorhabditis brenneri]